MQDSKDKTFFPSEEIASLSNNQLNCLPLSKIKKFETVDMPVPILFRYYLSLGGKALSFGKDPEFHNCLDTLFVFEVSNIPKIWLKKFAPNHAASVLH